MSEESPPPIPEEELETHVDQHEDGLFIARALHRPTMTLKISDLWPSADEALNQVKTELAHLIHERLRGLGSR